jgi:murein DD-endopeptidase MepM/ murein hydrolase activator NlpD
VRAAGPILSGVILLLTAAAQPAAAAAGPSSVSLACPGPGPSNKPMPTPTLTTVPPSSPSGADLCAQQRLLDEVRQRLGANLAAALAIQDAVRTSLEENDRAQSALITQIAEARQVEAALDAKLKGLEEAENVTQSRIASDRSRAAALARSLYFSPDSFLLSILRAGSLQELIAAASDSFAAGSRTAADEDLLTTDLQRLRQEHDQTAAARAAKALVEAGLQADVARLAELRQTQEESSRNLANQIVRTKVELANADKQSADLAQRISVELDAEETAIIARAVQEVWAQVLLWERSGASTALPISGSHSTKYPLVWPEPGSAISQPFGPSDLVLEPSYGAYPHFHTGLDLAAPALTPVIAADDGLVAVVGSTQTGYGNYVVLSHRSGLLTLYGHLQRALVQPGEVVAQGQPIGLEGSTGNSTGPHLHFEVRLKDQPLDPTLYLPPGMPSTFGLNGD